jgi:hypothetical protein
MMPGGITYDLKNERVNVGYSDSSCEKGQAEWNVPSGTVTSIIIYPQTKLMLSYLLIDLNRFEKFINPHNPDSVSYNNKEEGIGIGTKSNGEVVVIEYFPAARDSHLRCPNFRPDQLSNDEMQYYKFDEYSNIPFSDEKARLDNFAIHLQKDEPQSKGYIVVYAGPGARSGQAQARAKRAKDYLVKVRGIEAARIVSIDGGCRDRLEVELYVSAEFHVTANTESISRRVDDSYCRLCSYCITSAETTLTICSC